MGFLIKSTLFNMSDHFVVILVLCVALNASSALAAATGRSIQEAFDDPMNSPATAIGFARNPRQFMNMRRVPTVTITHVFTVTKITNVGVVCAKLVNVTGQCNRRRRGFWQGEDEEPIILSFDDDVNRAVDILYTPTLNVEPTAEPAGHVTFRSSGITDDRYTPEVISSSMEETARDGDDMNEYSSKPRLYFQELADIMQSIYQRLRPQTRTTVTETIIQTFTIATKTTTTATFFIQRCTPSPFPFRICNHRHKSSSSSSFTSSSTHSQQSSIKPSSTHHHHSEHDHTHSPNHGHHNTDDDEKHN